MKHSDEKNMLAAGAMLINGLWGSVSYHYAHFNVLKSTVINLKLIS